MYRGIINRLRLQSELSFRGCELLNPNDRHHSFMNHQSTMFEATPEFAIAFTKFTSIIGSSWPLYKNASKLQVVIFNIKWWFFFIMSVLAFLPMFYAAYKNSRNILSFTRSLFGGVNCSQVCIKMLLCKVHYPQYQYLFSEIEENVKDATAKEREIFTTYIKRCCKLHLVLISNAVMAAFIVIVAPIKIPQPFPAITEYPFPVDGHPTFELIYLQQSIATFHCISISVFDCQIALLLWYAGAKLELLGDEFKNVTNSRQFTACVQKHHYLLGFIEQIIISSRYILVTTVVTCTIAVITSGIHLVANDLMVDKISFVILSIGFSMVLYASAWPSEHLTQMCKNIGSSLYQSSWIKNSKELNKGMLIVIHRSQKPPAIQVTGVLPALSLQYYATFLSKTFSYFTTLRVLLDKMEIGQE